MQDTYQFQIVKAGSLNDNEAAIDITCPVCHKTVNYEGTFERVRANKEDFVNNHSCQVMLEAVTSVKHPITGVITHNGRIA